MHVGVQPAAAQPAAVQLPVRPPVRWQRGELIGAGASGSVYMGMDLDSGELIAIKQVGLRGEGGGREGKLGSLSRLE